MVAGELFIMAGFPESALCLGISKEGKGWCQVTGNISKFFVNTAKLEIKKKLPCISCKEDKKMTYLKRDIDDLLAAR
jgi:hypothetical protein